MDKIIQRQTALDIYKRMIQIRKFEEKLYYLFLTRPMPGSMHQYIGEEAVAAGVCAHLSESDYITSTHRGHGHCIAKGADMSSMMAEIFAKKTGCCKGMGGSMHITDISKGILGTNGIVGAGIPIAVGAGWKCKYNKQENISVSFFGDGASNEGAFHESINLAAIWKLPVVFVCENNMYGFSTHYKRSMTIDDIAVRAGSYGIPGIVADGMDAAEVYQKAGEAIERARNGKGPTLIECKTYRYMGHSRFENSGYRTKEEITEWKKRDPILLFRQYLFEKLNIDKDNISAIDEEAEKLVEEAVKFAEQSPDTDSDDYLNYLYEIS